MEPSASQRQIQGVTPLLLHPGQSALFGLGLFGSPVRYAMMAAYSTAVVNTLQRYDKRDKSTHRFAIADTHGAVDLTVPVAKVTGRNLTWSDIPLSKHGKWWHVILTTLESAYGRTPYYEFVSYRFDELLREPQPGDSVATLCLAADRAVMSFLAPDTEVKAVTETSRTEAVSIIEPKAPTSGQTPAYRQIRADKLGFLSGLSILDVIYNLGPEASVFLRRFQI